MTQQNNTMNLVIQDSNGQMIKLIQPSGKHINVMTSAISGQPIKIIKAPVSGQDTPQVFTSGQSIIKTLAPTKLIKPLNFAKTESGQVVKTIRLTPQQLQQIKVNSGVPGIQVQTIPLSNSKQQNIQTPKHSSPPILDHGIGRKRIEPYDMIMQDSMTKRRKTEKVGKGLRHFSMKVCEKVRQKGTTSYNEVADELVAEFTSSDLSVLAEQYDQKNIRRRVYDALNVLMAMNIISKEKKEIRWIGLPSNSVQECMQLEREREKRLQRIKEKREELRELVFRQITYKSLVTRNKTCEETYGPPNPNAIVHMPFLVMSTSKQTMIDTSISEDKKDYTFSFTDFFKIDDDSDVFVKIGMLKGIDKGDCSEEDLEKIKEMIPKGLHDYITQLNANKGVLEPMDDLSRAGPSNLSFGDDLMDPHLDEESRQSSSLDPLSPCTHYSDEDDSDMSSDIN